MGQNQLIRINKESTRNQLLCYRIAGLNLFTANTPCGNSEMIAMQHSPFYQFVREVCSNYDTVCLLGAPSVANWTNEMKRKGQPAALDEFLGKSTRYENVPIYYYGGQFGSGAEYGASILFTLYDDRILEEICQEFLRWDAVMFITYKNKVNPLGLAKKAFNGFSNEEALFEAILNEASMLLISQGDNQYLEIYSKMTEIEPELDKARERAEAFVKNTEWYKANRSRLVWSDLDLCYVKGENAVN